MDIAQLNTWRVIGASVVGTSHVENATPCQDAHGWRILLDGTLVLAVADGAGSAVHSADGASCAVATALDAVESLTGDTFPNDEAAWQSVIRQVFTGARFALEQLAASRDEALREYSTTLSVVVLTENDAISGQIGDGAIVTAGSDGQLRLAVQPQRGEYANEAYFLTMAGALDRLEVTVDANAVAGVAIISDGLLRLALTLPDYIPFERFYRPLFAFVTAVESLEDAQAELVAMLESERTNDRTDDDKTLVTAVRVVQQPINEIPE